MNILIHYILFIAIIISYSCSSSTSHEEISRSGIFITKSGSANIEGELFLPVWEGPFPVVVIVPGSGDEPRAELEQFVPIIIPTGYAVYIYDKRGIANSTGSYPPETDSTQTEFLNARAEDVLGIINLLKTHSRIDKQQIGLFGSSQGAWVNSIVYSRSNDISKFIMTSGGVASTGIEKYYESFTADTSVSIQEATTELFSFEGAHGFDPSTIINNITIPVLWIYGNEDRSHPSRYDVQILEGLNKSNFTIHLFANLNHDLLDITTNEYPSFLFDSLKVWLINEFIGDFHEKNVSQNHSNITDFF